MSISRYMAVAMVRCSCACCRDALKEYEASQVREPERFHGYYGAARAAAQAGDKLKARRYYAKLVAMADPGSTRPEVAQARAFLAANP